MKQQFIFNFSKGIDMKTFSLVAAAVLATVALTASAQNTAKVRVPALMNDAQMKGVVGAGSPGFGLCTATSFANGGNGAPGAINTWTAFPQSTHQVGNVNGNGNQPGFGLSTAKGQSLGCFVVG
jgi:hypothetical protein